MNSEHHDKALAYLREHNVMTLATSGPQGLWAAAVFYVSEGFTLYFLSAPTSRHSRNLAAQPAISAAIHEDYRDWRVIKGIQLEGEAVRIEGREAEDAWRSYGEKFPFVAPGAQAPAAITSALSRIAWYRLVPTHLSFVDNELGFGHRDELF
jgi:hypothetical protein